MKKNSLHTLFIIRVSPKKYENFLTLLQKTLVLIESFPDIPGFCVHWNFPSFPLFEDHTPRGSAMVQTLKDRVDGGIDLFIPQGYAGTFHRFLMPVEIENELSWSFENSWESGAGNVFKDRPPAFMPLDLDLFRFSSKMIYGNVHLPLIIPPPRVGSAGKEKEEDTLFILHEEEMASLPLIKLDANGGDIFTKLKRKAGKSAGPVAVFANIESLQNIDQVNDFLSSVSRLLNKNVDVSFLSLPECFNSFHFGHEPGAEEQGELPFPLGLTNDGILHSALYPPCWPFNPEDRFFLSELTEARSGNESIHNAFAKEGLRKLLVSGGVFLRQNSGQLEKRVSGGNGPNKRSISANMPGSATISESGFEVTFFEGRFTNIILESKPVIIGMPVNSFIGKERFMPVHDINAFAFDEEDIRGMREILQIKPSTSGRPGSLTIDYYLVADYPFLIVDVFTTYPSFEQNTVVDGYGSFQLPLFMLSGNERVGITATYPDDEEYTISYGADDRPCSINGSCFTFSRWSDGVEKEETSLVIRSYSGLNPLIFSMGMKIEKHEKKHPVFTVNPFGSYETISTAAINGLEEHFTLILSVRQGKKKPEPELTREITALNKPYWVLKR